jgi:hypothetical protein
VSIQPHPQRDNQPRPPISPEQTLQLFAELDAGKTVAEAAQAVNVNLRTAYRILEKYEAAAELAIPKLLRINGIQLLEDWLSASRHAAEKGDHRPAKDALLHAGAIDPVSDGSAGHGVTIVIGTPQQPIRVALPDIDG